MQAINMNVGATTALLTALIFEAAKRIDTERKLKRFYPLFSIILGGFIGILISPDNLIDGIVAGAAASGLYDTVKKTMLNK